MCAVSLEVAPRNVPMRFAGDVTFLIDFFELLDHLPRFDDHLRLLGDLRAQIEKIASDRIARRQRGDDAIEFIE